VAPPISGVNLKNMSDYSEQLRDKLAREHYESYHKSHGEAAARQREIARQNQNRKSVDGIGRPIMEVDSKVYHEWTRKEGKEIWKDPSFRKYISEKNPELKVKSGGTGKTQVGYGS
jgi:DNA repair photolyase